MGMCRIAVHNGGHERAAERGCSKTCFHTIYTQYITQYGKMPINRVSPVSYDDFVVQIDRVGEINMRIRDRPQVLKVGRKRDRVAATTSPAPHGHAVWQ